MGDAGAGAIRGKDDPPVTLAPAPAEKIADIDVEAQTWLSAKSDASRTRSGIPGLRSFGGSEKRRVEQATAGDAVEYTVPTSKKFAHLGVWFVLNLVLTIFNKAVLGEVRAPGSSSSFLKHLTAPRTPHSLPWSCLLTLTSSHTRGC